MRPLILFAPGAGAPSTSTWMQAWTGRLGTLGDVVAFDYPYMRAGRRSPDRPATLIAAHREALAAARQRFTGPVVLAGKSMGSRIGCHAALVEPDVRALVCLGYPLKSGATGAQRDEVLVALRGPVLFVQGTRDPLCPLAALAEVRPRMTARHELYVVEGGNHSLELPKRQLAAARQTQEDADARALGAIAKFLASALG